jgi:flavin-binding protein dodecin
MSDSVYKVIELIGSSPVSWEKAAENAIESAGLSIRDMRIAEVTKLDMKLEGDKGLCYRARMQLSFKILSD